MGKFLWITFLLALAFPVYAQEAGWIGVRVEDQRDRGVIVRNVESNSPASRAGLKEGDIITQFGKEDVLGVQQFSRLVRETPVGRTAEMKIKRDNRDQTVHVTAERSPTLRDSFNGFNIRMPDIRIGDFPRVEVNTTYTQSGIRIERLTDQLRDFFGVYSNGGVLVTSVDPGSAAEKAGLKAGDVVTAVDGRNIRTPAEFGREMRGGSSTKTVKIIRNKQEQEIKF
jgi:serine protease Do